jgi:hypothetical protein
MRAAQHLAKKKEHEEHQELNTMMAEAVASAMKIQSKMMKCEKASNDDQLAEQNYNFSKLTKKSDNESSVVSTSSGSSSSNDVSDE